MIEIVTILLFIILFARASEEYSRIPTTLFLITYSYLGTLIFSGVITITSDKFDSILYLMIPVILLPDLLKISIEEFQKNLGAILYLAVVSVVVSITIAVGVAWVILPYEISVVALIALFTMLMATDAITVSSIFANFHLPSQLKIYAEGESLLNDVTALVLFYFIALPMINGIDISLLEINQIIAKVVGLSIFIGLACAVLGFWAIRILKDPIEQFIIIYLVSIVSFIVAEHLHISGILSVITAIVSFRVILHKELKKDPSLLISKYKKQHNEGNMDIYSFVSQLAKYTPAMTRREFRGYKKEATYIGIFANGVVFIIIAYLFEFPLLFEYAYEIVAVFLLTTAIRYGSIFLFMKVKKKQIHWTNSLTLSGVKGALTIIMVHSLPKDFIHLELFEAIIVGNVILSTFIYTIVLVIYINISKNRFKQDIINEGEQKNILIDGKNIDKIIKSIQKDSDTKAYNKAFIEEILEKEIARAIRYKLELSIIAFKLQNITIFTKEQQKYILQLISKEVFKKIRTNDYFGKIDNNYFLILTTNTSLSGATILASRLEKKFKKIELKDTSHKLHSAFGVADTSETDNIETMMEKITDALKKAKHNHNIQIAY